MNAPIMAGIVPRADGEENNFLRRNSALKCGYEGMEPGFTAFLKAIK